MEPPSADPGIDRVLAERLSGAGRHGSQKLVEQIVGSGVASPGSAGRLGEHATDRAWSRLERLAFAEVEQCLAIATAREGPSNPYPGEPGKWRNGFFCIDEYLEVVRRWPRTS